MSAIEGRLSGATIAPRLSSDVGWATYAAAVAAAFVAGVTLTEIESPAAVVGASFVCTAFLLAFWKYGANASLLFLLVALPLVPVTEGSFPAFLGSGGRLARGALLGGLVALSILVAAGRTRSIRLPTRPIAAALALMAGVGVLVAFANASGLSSASAILASSAGQPALYALVLSALCAYASTGSAARRNLLGAWCWAVVLEGVIVVVEVASGSAYDPLRGITRGQGTMGADFLGVFGMLGLFAGLALRNAEGGGGRSRLGTWTIAAAIWLMIAAVARGGVIGTLIGLLYLFVRNQRARRRAISVVAVAAVLLGLVVTGPAKSLWNADLGNRSLTSFDRPATWASGFRMARDHPVTGLGSTADVETALASNFDYRYTSFGETSSIPHNSLLLALVQGGVLYFIAALGAAVVTVRAIWRRPQPGRSEDAYLTAGLLGFAAVACINNLFSHPDVTVFALAAIALLLARDPAPPASSDE